MSTNKKDNSSSQKQTQKPATSDKNRSAPSHGTKDEGHKGGERQGR